MMEEKIEKAVMDVVGDRPIDGKTLVAAITAALQAAQLITLHPDPEEEAPRRPHRIGERPR